MQHTFPPQARPPCTSRSVALLAAAVFLRQFLRVARASQNIASWLSDDMYNNLPARASSSRVTHSLKTRHHHEKTKKPVRTVIDAKKCSCRQAQRNDMADNTAIPESTPGLVQTPKHLPSKKHLSPSKCPNLLDHPGETGCESSAGCQGLQARPSQPAPTTVGECNHPAQSGRS